MADNKISHPLNTAVRRDGDVVLRDGFGFKGPVYPVNPTATSIENVQCYRQSKQCQMPLISLSSLLHSTLVIS
jgi:hypothetical protein